MPSNKRQKELARRRAERQAQRRAAERAARRKRRTVLGTSIGVGALAIALVALLLMRGGDGKDTVEPQANDTPTPTAAATPTGPCQVVADPAEKGGEKKPGRPPDPSFGATKTQTGVLTLSKGTVEMTMYADKAPCTVSSFKHLASKKYFDGTKCHRQTGYESLVVLQCGDPTGTGSGGPGYRFKDENLPTAGPDGQASYPRGTIAMANAGAGTNGSQFFLVLKDSKLEPKYTVIGKVTKGLEVLDAINAAGIKDKQQDGPPAQDVTIKSFTVG